MVIIKDRSEALYLLNSSESLISSVIRKENELASLLYISLKKRLFFRFFLSSKYPVFFDVYLSKKGLGKLFYYLQETVFMKSYLEKHLEVSSIGISISYLRYLEELGSYDSTADTSES